MAGDSVPVSLSRQQLKNIQGDIWSKGFPKNYETYYFFSIVSGEEQGFSQCLRGLTQGNDPLISNLEKVKADRESISSHTPVTNALIAFTFQGLLAIEKGLSKPDDLESDVLGLEDVEETDPAFFKGMTPGRKKTGLYDPVRETWDPLFQSEKDIHGLLKIAGFDKEAVDTRLKAIQGVLQHGKFCKDVASDTGISSRVDGWVRPKPHRGKEHFGFHDGISQPRIEGIDNLEAPPIDGEFAVNMNTLPHIILVTKDTHVENLEHKRPTWMYDGSFLVFRKLEQDVAGWEALTDQWQDKGCKSKTQMGAKLMGRWPSGKPVSMFDEEELVTAQQEEGRVEANDFAFGKNQACPLSSHIRKCNLRTHADFTDPQDERSRRTRIVRSGIPYGPEYVANESKGSERGLLFACYQGQIEDGFIHLQARWSNSSDFPEPDCGHDPVIGQVAQVKPGVNGQLTTIFTGQSNTDMQTVSFQQLVTMKGGSYFFVPSISALQNELSAAET